ncbi:LytTR family transcriptional regulator [Clostridium botulinum]|uniref:LytTR family transcriptional regulator n=1 Tax=Clostridium botulinum TaxID=1491 RepID=A0ABC8CX40_CLOBO|nr:LytTR family DNA-binding domain-containing protein [Clostridium botulinum]AVQ38767.1 LytTR family transcriptional regulator [Clostridium botulinum]MBO0574844.1 LytTR family transcriptional regulator [Clostridium botulinum]
MKIDIQIDDNSKETRVVIYTSEITEEVQAILNNLKRVQQKYILGMKDERIYILNPDEISFFYSEKGKVFAQTYNLVYEIKEKLYKLEENLKGTSFVRISKSAIANVDKIKNLEILFNGNMCINFFDGKQEYISRRYMKKIREYLNIGGK